MHDAATVRASYNSSVSISAAALVVHAWRCGPAQVLLDGVAVGRLDRNGPHNLTLDAKAARAAALQAAEGFAVLDVIVEAVGRSNQVLFDGPAPRITCHSCSAACCKQFCVLPCRDGALTPKACRPAASLGTVRTVVWQMSTK